MLDTNSNPNFEMAYRSSKKRGMPLLFFEEFIFFHQKQKNKSMFFELKFWNGLKQQQNEELAKEIDTEFFSIGALELQK